MHVCVDRENLKSAVQQVQHSVAKTTTHEILTGILVDAGENLTLRTTDLHIATTCTVPAKVEQSGSVVVSAKQFARLCQTLSNDQVVLQSDTDSLQIIDEPAEISLLVMPAENYPEPLTAEEVATVSAPRERLLRAMKAVAFVPLPKEDQPFLRGVFFRISDVGTVLCATDSNRLAEFVLPEVQATGEAEAMLDIEDVQTLLKVLSKSEVETVGIAVGGNHAAFSAGNLTITCRLLEGDFPKYERVIPTDFDTEMELDRNRLLQALKRVNALFEEKTTPVIFEGKEDRLEIKPRASDLGSAKDEVPYLSHEGQLLLRAYQIGYLVEGLRAMQTEKVSFRANNDLRPAVISPIEGENYRYVVMPLREAEPL